MKWIIALIIAIILVLILSCFSLKERELIIQLVKSKKRIRKKDILKLYGITKPTFNKWFSVLHSDFWKEIKGKNTYSSWEVIGIYLSLGFPNSETKVWGKRELVNELSISYKTFKKRVLKFVDEIGITIFQFEQLSVFPPTTAERMIAVCK